MNATLKLVTKRPHEEPKITIIDNWGQEIMKTVGGSFGIVTIAKNAVILYNIEKREKKQNHNCKVCGADFYGPITFIGYDIYERDFCDCPIDLSTIRGMIR